MPKRFARQRRPRAGELAPDALDPALRHLAACHMAASRLGPQPGRGKQAGALMRKEAA